MEQQLEKEFEKEFGKDDNFKTFIIKLIIKSYNNINRRNNNKNIENFPQPELFTLWEKKKHYYQSFISKMLGKIMDLYNFNDEKSILMKDNVKNINTSLIDANLKNNGYHVLDKKLNIEICTAIKKYLTNINFKPYQSQRKVKGGIFLGKNGVIDGSTTFWVDNQDDILAIPEVRQLVTDPFILQIVQNYLGCNPILCQTNLWYSCAGNKVERTQQFHQDYDDINFLKIFIYLTDVNENSGAHSYISNSLNNLIVPAGYKVSQRLTDSFAKNTYGDKIKLFTGDTGTIIIENTNGFHRGMPITKGNRLILQLQYGATLLPFQQGCYFSNLQKNDFMKKYSLCYLKLNN